MLFITEVLPLVCIWAAAVTGYTTHPSVFCVGKEPKKYPVPDDCRKYYDCEQGDKTLCYIEQSFDPISAKCSMTYDKCDLATGLSDGQESDVPGMNYLEFCTEKTQNTDTYYTGDTKDCDMKLTCWKQIYSPDIYLDIIGSSCPYGESYSPQDQRCTVEAYRQCRNITAAAVVTTTEAAAVVTTTEAAVVTKPEAAKPEDDACFCEVSGDPLVHTFDGNDIPLVGSNRFLLSKSVNASPACKFWVFLTTGFIKEDVTYPRRFEVAMSRYNIIMEQDGVIKLGNETKTLPFTLLDIDATEINGYSVLSLKNCDTTIAFKGSGLDTNGIVRAPESDSGYNGLCGTCNDGFGVLRRLDGSTVTGDNKFEEMSNAYVSADSITIEETPADK